MAAKKTLARLLRLWAMYARLDLIWITRDLKMFLFWTFADSILNIAMVTGIWLLSERFAGLGAWNRLQVLFLLGYATTVGAILQTFFGFNVSHISRRLGRGQFDHTLIQPQPIWMALLTDGFVPFSGGAMLLPGIGLLAYSVQHMRLHITPLWFGLLLLNLFASVVVSLSFQFLWGSLAFWAPRSAEEISSSTNELMTQLRAYPLDGLSGVFLVGLLTALPVGFVAWVPCRALLALRVSPASALTTPLAAAIFAFCTTFVFQKGLRHYGRTGSQRYSDRGHRS